jgi:pimeloyl-ACP methyl ester carboxylesterase
MRASAVRSASLRDVTSPVLVPGSDPDSAGPAGQPGGVSTPERSWPRRHRRLLLAGVLPAIPLLLLAVAAAASWHFSSAVLVSDHSPAPANVTVKALAPGRVVLSRSDATLRPGVYGLEWSGGHAIVEAVLGSDEHTVTRQVKAMRGRLTPGTKVALDAGVYRGNPARALALPFASVKVPDELGPMPAWLVPGSGDTWAIVVHGLNGDREDNLRIAPTLHADGLPTLLITYREDAGVPAAPDGLHHMGLTEWRDLQAAARYALSHGARRLVLLGYSMGGAIVTQFMERSPLARRAAGLVLDAPALDWKAILSFNATEMGLPSFAATPVEWMIGARIDVSWSALDALDHTADFHLPILLFHGRQDELVPISTSDAFARALPRWVTFFRVPRANHVESWNVNPSLYDARLTRFLSRLGA